MVDIGHLNKSLLIDIQLLVKTSFVSRTIITNVFIGLNVGHLYRYFEFCTIGVSLTLWCCCSQHCSFEYLHVAAVSPIDNINLSLYWTENSVHQYNLNALCFLVHSSRTHNTMRWQYHFGNQEVQIVLLG